MNYKSKIVINEGIVWGEGPRWREDGLYLSDIFGKAVLKINVQGQLEKVVSVPGYPSGLGFLPEGKLLIVSGMDGTLYTNEQGTLKEYKKIYEAMPEALGINDMVVASNGNAYIGTYGFDIQNYSGGLANGWITLVTPDFNLCIAGDGLMCPNGLVITSNGKQLIVADTFAKQLIAYDIEANGHLTNRSVWAQLGGGPDGIAIDIFDNVWAAIPSLKQVVKVEKGGKITDIVETHFNPLACAIGGEEGKTLFIISVSSHASSDIKGLSNTKDIHEKSSYVEAVNLNEMGIVQ